jgi:cell wall-associated NlpC family hydrolase
MLARHATSRRNHRPRLAALVGAAVVTTLMIPLAAAPTAAAAPTQAAPTVSHLSVHRGLTWGGDEVIISGTGFDGTRGRRVATVLFGRHKADWVSVVNATTIRAYSPAVRDRRAAVDLRVVLRDGTSSPRTRADVFTFLPITRNSPLNWGWSAAESRRIANSMIGKARRVNARPVAHNAGHWTPAMGRSAVRRAAAWLGMPYTWAGGSATGPTYGSCYGDGLIGKFDCTFRGFDCSGLTLYAWAKYRHLDHYAATQRRTAGRFHPSLSELQPGDLLFFSGGGSVISHVVMYAGRGKIIQAAMSGWPVRYNTLAEVLAGEPRYFGATRPMSTGRQGAPPVVTSISTTRSSTGGGSTITLHGRHLDTTAHVSFGSTGTYRFTVRSASTVTVTVPAHRAQTVSVRVTNAWGWSAATSRAQLTYIQS